MEVPPGIDPDGAFRVCVQFSQFTAKFNDGSSVLVARKYDEWVVDYRSYSMERLVKDLATRVTWGTCQQPLINEFDNSTGCESNLADDKALALAFSDRLNSKKLFLFIDVEDKSVVTEVVLSNVVTDKAKSVELGTNSGVTEVGSSIDGFVAHVVDWDSLQTEPIPEEQIGAAVSFMDEDAMYEFVGLREEDERAEKAKIAAEKEMENGACTGGDDLDGTDLAVHDLILGEDAVDYDREFEHMCFQLSAYKVGSTYATMSEFRGAMRQHAIKEQFELGTEKSCTDRFRGYCKANGCPWAIVARLLHDGHGGKHVRVILL